MHFLNLVQGNLETCNGADLALLCATSWMRNRHAWHGACSVFVNAVPHRSMGQWRLCISNKH